MYGQGREDGWFVYCFGYVFDLVETFYLMLLCTSIFT